MSTDADPALLLPAVYDELRRIAAIQMSRLPAGSTLQPTALVHEAWLRLDAAEQAKWRSRAHFFAASAEAMRHILIDRARQRRAERHGGGQVRVSIDDIEVPIRVDDDECLLIVSDAVDRLAKTNPDAAELAKLRCFAGLEINDAAHVLGISRATAFRRWAFAKTWLYSAIKS